MVRKLAVGGQSKRVELPWKNDNWNLDLWVHGGGRFLQTGPGRVEYVEEQPGDHKMVHVKYFDLHKFGLLDIYHIGAKMGLRSGVPTIAWYEYPQEPGTPVPIPDIIELPTDGAVELMHWHLQQLKEREVTIYLQDRARVVDQNTGLVVYELPDEVPGFRNVLYTNRYLWARVAMKMNEELRRTPEENQALIDSRAIWRIV